MQNRKHHIMRRLALLLILTIPFGAAANETFAWVTCQKTFTEETLGQMMTLGIMDKGGKLRSPITSEGACLSDIRVEGAMGGIIAFMGKVCSEEIKPLINSFNLGNSAPALDSESSDYVQSLLKKPGVLAASGSTGRLIVIYQGQPNFGAQADIDSRDISYTCLASMATNLKHNTPDKPVR